jgi:hypothetical protein
LASNCVRYSVTTAIRTPPFRCSTGRRRGSR